VEFARAIERLIDRTSLEIFRIYKSTLLSEPNVYIVPAVWGAAKNGELTEIQKDIHKRVAPVIQEILALLHQEDLNISQQFAVGYILRGFFISKIIYMIEFYKNLSNENHTAPAKEAVNLQDIEPWGHA